MKKTLIALMALAGVATGATTTTEWSFDNTLSSTGGVEATGTWVAGQNGNAAATYGTDTTYGTYLILDNAGYVKVSNTYWSTGDGKLQLGSADTSFTISAVVSFDAIPAAGTQVFILGTSNNHDEGFAFTLDGGKLGITAKSVAHHTLSSMDALSANTWYTLSVTYDASTNEADFSVNGTSVGTYTVPADAGFDPAEANTGLAIGSASTGQTQGLWSGKIASLSITTTAPIPEPTTATLSLLALAGLAARRRRH